MRTSPRNLERPAIGTRFGRRVVVGFPPPGKNGATRVTMRCDCGRVGDTDLHMVLHGKADRCMPCSKKKDPATLPPIGTRFGKRVIAAYLPGGHRRLITAIMRCDCGDEAEAPLRNLQAGELTQCIHCWVESNLDNLHTKTREKNQTKDRSNDHTKQPEYACWSSMWDRCRNPNNPAYGRYGGAGITVVEEWKDFQVFLRDMGRRPSKRHTIERKDGTKGYSKENCEWADWFQQQNNTKQNVWLEFGGRRQTVAQWAREKGIRAGALRMRLADDWSIERALNTPISQSHSEKGRKTNLCRQSAPPPKSDESPGPSGG